MKWSPGEGEGCHTGGGGSPSCHCHIPWCTGVCRTRCGPDDWGAQAQSVLQHSGPLPHPKHNERPLFCRGPDDGSGVVENPGRFPPARGPHSDVAETGAVLVAGHLLQPYNWALPDPDVAVASSAEQHVDAGPSCFACVHVCMCGVGFFWTWGPVPLHHICFLTAIDGSTASYLFPHSH